MLVSDFKSSRCCTILFSVLILCVGCQQSKVAKSVVADFGGNSDDEQMEFWHRLNDAPVASNDDAFHAVLLYFDGRDEHTSYDARVTALKSRQMLPAGFNQTGDVGVERGTLAVALTRGLQLRGGLIMRTIGVTPRYAVRELYYEGVYPPSSAHQTFSGAELVGIIGRIDDYQHGDPANKPAAVLAGESPK